jgi:regulatory protein
MQSIQISALTPQERGRVSLKFDNGVEVLLYRGELRKAAQLEGRQFLQAGDEIQTATYEAILQQIVGLRAKKRAMHLLEQMDRTEYQLCEKLRQNGYPESCIEQAVDYVKRFHYIDDLRYASQYIRCQQEKKSCQRLRMDLMKRGVAREVIEAALETEFCSDEREKIAELLQKRRYDADGADRKEQQRMYQYLLRRGYKSNDILAVMKNVCEQ